MAKKVSKKVKPSADASVEIKTPYPKEEKKKVSTATKKDVDFVGEELVKLSNRLNELELTVNDMDIKVKQVSNRMGL